MLKLIASCAALLLTACATEPPKPITRTETIKVEVPVAVKCVDAKDLPTIPKTSLRTDGDTRQLAAGAAADVYALQTYAEKADALLRNCVK